MKVSCYVLLEGMLVAHEASINKHPMQIFLHDPKLEANQGSQMTSSITVHVGVAASCISSLPSRLLAKAMDFQQDLGA